MSFWEHLEELRWVIIRAAGVLVALIVALFCVMPMVFDSVILGPTSSDFFVYKLLSGIGKIPLLPDFGDGAFKVDIINIHVAAQFTTHISASFYLALVLVAPYLLYEIWKFIRPALYEGEIANVRTAFALGGGMFFIGCGVGYCIIFPFTFRFLTEYTLSESIVNQINLSSYMGIFFSMILIMGLVFELPLLAWILSKIGLVRKAFLKTYRRHAIVVLLIAAAVITPTGDPFTLSLVFLPLYLLYEFSILLVRP